MVVHAPIDGVVYYGSMNRGRMSDSTTAASRLRPGASALANQVLMTVVATRPLQVSGDLAETDLRYATPGKPCKIEAKAFPDHTL